MSQLVAQQTPKVSQYLKKGNEEVLFQLSKTKGQPQEKKE